MGVRMANFKLRGKKRSLPYVLFKWLYKPWDCCPKTRHFRDEPLNKHAPKVLQTKQNKIKTLYAVFWGSHYIEFLQLRTYCIPCKYARKWVLYLPFNMYNTYNTYNTYTTNISRYCMRRTYCIASYDTHGRWWVTTAAQKIQQLRDCCRPAAAAAAHRSRHLATYYSSIPYV